MHARKRQQEWRGIIRAFEQSGQTHQAFCAGRRLNLGSFRGWLYRIRRETTADVRLVPVEVSGWSAPVDVASAARANAAAPIVLVVGDVELRITAGSDPAYVAALVRELGRC
jgi:hypothetical protein